MINILVFSLSHKPDPTQDPGWGTIGAPAKPNFVQNQSLSVHGSLSIFLYFTSSLYNTYLKNYNFIFKFLDSFF